MKAFILISVFSVALGCTKDKIDPIMKLDVIVGESFVITAPAEITIKETGHKIYISEFTDLMSFSVSPPLTSVKMIYNGSKIELFHSLACELTECSGSSAGDAIFYEEAVLDDHYLLRYNSVISTTLIKTYDQPTKNKYKVDSAQFTVK